MRRHPPARPLDGLGEIPKGVERPPEPPVYYLGWTGDDTVPSCVPRHFSEPQGISTPEIAV